MSANIVHFGNDASKNLMVLRHFNFEVRDCGVCLSSFAEQLAQEADVIVFTDADPKLEQEAVQLAHSSSASPLVLFQQPITGFDSSQFDLVVPSFTPPLVWIESIQSLIEKSKQLRASSKTVIRNSMKLRSASADLRQDSARVREYAESECLHSMRQRKKHR